MSEQDRPSYISLKEAQERLGFSQKRMSYVVSHNRFETNLVGEQLMVDTKSLDKYIDTRKNMIPMNVGEPDVPTDVGPMMSPRSDRKPIRIIKD